MEEDSRRYHRTGTIIVGPYSGEVASRYRVGDFLASLTQLPQLLTSRSAQTVAAGRNRHVRIDMPVDGRSETVIVKAFGRQIWWKDMRDRARGSKARRTWIAAQHLMRADVGTPQPIGYLDRWEHGRLVESYFFAVYQHDADSFRDALWKLFDESPEAANFMDLLECVAAGVRAMHASGFLHNDLGNQNILLKRVAPARWSKFQVIDLNRGRIGSAPGLLARARDLSRLDLPSALLAIFIDMYWHSKPPEPLLRWERCFRWLYSLHARSRPLRHPIREARLRRKEQSAHGVRRYPELRDMWIWDERSGQPVSAVESRDRRRMYPMARGARMLRDTLSSAPSIWREYRALMAGAFQDPVNVAGRVGMAVNPAPETASRELELLQRLGAIPAFVRFYHHENTTQRRFRSELVHALHRAGHPVSIAIVQDRKAVTTPAVWRDFASDVLGTVADIVDMVEIGHNINRAKWGVWDFRELRAMYDALDELRARYPGLRLMGPAAIDFEYAFLISALREWPRDVPLAALSHHLYVDRRGAPENVQSTFFSSIEKFALARAIARASGVCADRLVISEVNWPIKDAGVYSPIRAPYLPAYPTYDAGATEEEYGHYLLRYLCLALASGLVDRVYWWRLVSRGFGLVDDRDANAWRERPAYHMLRHFLSVLGDATFEAAQLPQRIGNRHGRYRFVFRRPDGETVVLTYAHGPALAFPRSEAFSYAEDATGTRVPSAPETLGPGPVYLRWSETSSRAALQGNRGFGNV